jgi:hypothetical protein
MSVGRPLPRSVRAHGWAVFVLVALIGFASAAQEGRIRMVSRDKSKLREGARLIDRDGKFSDRGERWYFNLGPEAESFTILENQTLERVVSASSNQDEGQTWTVTGLVTEFNGNRYLLLERAVLRPKKSETARP